MPTDWILPPPTITPPHIHHWLGGMQTIWVRPDKACGKRERCLQEALILPSFWTQVKDSRNISDALYCNTLQHFGCGIGLQEWWQITVALNQSIKDPEALQLVRNQTHNIVYGHTDATSDQHYRVTSEKPINIGWDLIFACERMFAWWHHITGM